MSAPADLIERLDRALSEYGQDIILQRLDTDTAGEQTVVYEAPCRAVVRAHYPQELDHIAFETLDTTVVLSPTDLVLAGWPEPIPAKDDRLLIAGRPNNVVTVSPIQVDGTLVRIDLTCRE